MDLELPDVTGPVLPQGWTPDGSRVLAHNDPGEGIHRLLMIDPGSGSVEEVVRQEGTIYETGFRAGGDLWYRG